MISSKRSSTSKCATSLLVSLSTLYGRVTDKACALRKREHGQLVKENEDLKQSIENLKRQDRAQKEEIADLKNELEAARAASTSKEQSDSGDEGDEAEAVSQNGDMEALTFPNITVVSTPRFPVDWVRFRKRSLETDDTEDVKKLKK